MNLEQTALAFAEIQAKLEQIDLNSIAKIYFEHKMIHNLEYLRSPEKIEVTELYFNELYETFKILHSKLNTPGLNTLLITFMDLKQSFCLDNKNNLRKLFDCMFKILNETNLSIPLIQKEKSFKSNFNTKISTDLTDDSQLRYFHSIDKAIKMFLSRRNNFFELSNHKSKEFYFYLVNDFEMLIKTQVRKAENCYYQYCEFNIQDYFKSDAHFDLKVFYNDKVNKKSYLSNEAKKIYYSKNVKETRRKLVC